LSNLPDHTGSARRPDITARFTAALTDIHAFSERNNCDPFTRSFQSALDCLADPEDCARSSGPCSTARCRRRRRRCGMPPAAPGSDMGFEGEADEEYRRVSDELYEVLREA
jgi:hypothetical protein